MEWNGSPNHADIQTFCTVVFYSKLMDYECVMSFGLNELDAMEITFVAVNVINLGKRTL